MLKPIVYCIIVSLPEAYCTSLVTCSKYDYITNSMVCQQNEKSTLEYNYITSEELIESNNNKYQEIFW